MPGGGMVLVILPPALVRLFPGATMQVELAAATVIEAIDALDRAWPGMRDRLCDSRPSLRRHIDVFVGGQRATLTTSLPAGTELHIVTAMLG